MSKMMKSKSTQPPQLQLAHRVSTVLRFQVQAGGSYSVTVADLAGACGGICSVVNTTVQPWASSIRLKQVTMYPASVSGSADVDNLVWSNGLTAFVKDEVKDTTIPTGITVPQRLTFRPTAKSLLADWIATNGASGALFVLTANAGSVVDVHIDYTLTAGLAEPATIHLSAATALGAIVYLALDGAASNEITPVGLPTTH
jgi:hypothetical protein